MFGKLKEKLRDALSIFSKKTEEEAEVKETIAEKKVPVKEEKKRTVEKKVKEASKKVEPIKKTVEEKKKEEKKDVTEERRDTKTILAKQKEHFEKVAYKKRIDEEIKPKEAVKKKIITEEIISIDEDDVNAKIKEEEKKGFFSRLFQKEEKAEEKKAEVKAKEELEEEDKGFFGKIKETLTTKTISAAKFEDFFWDLELALLENNVSVEVIEKIKEDLKKELVDKPLPRNVSAKIYATLNETLREILSCEKIDVLQRIDAKKNKPYVIAFFGINGTGKTTSIAKLTYYLQQQGRSVVLAACDTFRAAAIQQLGEHAAKLGVKMIAEKNKIDVVLIDTAGRLHSNTNLMAELEKIIRVVKPDLKIFVGESITGNDCIEQARTFNSLVEMDGAILTKVDVDEKGGAPVSIAYTIKKPILFLGVGQEYKDLEKFDAEVILERLGL